MFKNLTRVILVCQAAFTPFMIAASTKGLVSAFFYAFVGTFLLWFLDYVVDLLDNPFRKETMTLDMSSVQIELNLGLEGLLSAATQSPITCTLPEPIAMSHTFS